MNDKTKYLIIGIAIGIVIGFLLLFILTDLRIIQPFRIFGNGNFTGNFTRGQTYG